MKLSTGVDIIEIARIERLLKKEGADLCGRVFTEAEWLRIDGAAHRAASCFAAKEAVAKALGTGIRGFSLTDIEIIHDDMGAPCAILHGNAGKLLGERGISLSISHSKLSAVAFAVIFG